MFHNAIDEILGSFPGCKNISDGIIVYGKDQKEHYKNVHGLLERHKQYDIRLNQEKYSFSQTEIKFMVTPSTPKESSQTPGKLTPSKL